MYKNEKGFVLLIVLIAIAIGVLIYYADLKAVFNLDDKEDTEELMVWEEWQKIEKKGKPKLEFYKDQPKIDESLKFKTEVYQKDQKKGLIEISIEPEGIVRGNWSGSYIANGSNIQIKEANFKGWIYPPKIFRDRYGSDLTKVFFITKGSFLHTIKKSNKISSKSGDMYVSGWIDQDYIIKGEITLTTDLKQYDLFTFNSQKPIKIKFH